MPVFDKQMSDHQTAWREKNCGAYEPGRQNGRQRDWILPKDRIEDGLWLDLRSSGRMPLRPFLGSGDGKVQAHSGIHNLKSSWTLCANMYFHFREDGRELLASFLRRHVDASIETVDAVELEFSDVAPRRPVDLLGEEGSRGSGQTSPDIAFRCNGGDVLVLTENKFVEHSFYPCSARGAKPRADARPAPPQARSPNPDRSRCDRAAELPRSYPDLCHQVEWGRRYWDHLAGKVNAQAWAALRICPAAIAGYQLFRQQALAEALAESGAYELVVSSVAWDARNDTLERALRSTGLDSFAQWGALFDGKAGFAVFTHQQWVSHVRENGDPRRWAAWLDWIERRYDIR